MGTYTYYVLVSQESITNIPMSVDDKSAVECLFNYRSVEAKWYRHRDDLAKVSRANPTKLIIVECKSEDDDYWKLWFLNGVMREVKGELVYPEIDLLELYSLSKD